MRSTPSSSEASTRNTLTMVAVSSSRPASRSALSGRRMPASDQADRDHQAGQRIAVEFGDRHLRAGQDRALEALAHEQADAGDQRGEEGGEPEARARSPRPPAAAPR